MSSGHTLEDLVLHIISRFHVPLREELVRLTALVREVESEHAEDPELPGELVMLLESFAAAVETHLTKEEQILFPRIVDGRSQTAHMVVRALIRDHNDHAAHLRRIREITNDFAVPEHAGTSWRELCAALEQLEPELEQHMRLEEDELFRRALSG
jgi:regulator of cell morphogenesis and NO signaling